MVHCSSYLFSQGFGLFTNLLLSYLYLLLSLKMLVALWPSLEDNVRQYMAQFVFIYCLKEGILNIFVNMKNRPSRPC